jgi:Do/DeqQ family serine protease
MFGFAVGLGSAYIAGEWFWFVIRESSMIGPARHGERGGRTWPAAAILALLAAAMMGSPVQAQTRVAPTTRADVQASFSPVVKQAAPSVVNVYGARVEARPQNPFMDDPFFRRFFGNDGFGVPKDKVQQSLGSGVVVDASGLVVTNNHVIEGMTEVKVSLADKREFEAEIMLRDPRSDLAVLKLKNPPQLTVLPLGDADLLEVGDLVLAIGNPFGVGQTVTQGIVSALARTQVGVSDYQSFIQTDAAINPGNSGGALVDMQGRLVGINTAIFSRSGGSHGIGFAIPSSMVRVVIESARGGSKTVRRPWFGARLQIITAEMVDGLGLDRPTGVLVARVEDKGPAGEAGLKRSDVILGVDGATVDDPEAFGYRFATRPIGGNASLSIMRAGKRLVIPVKLQPAPETRPRDEIRLNNRSPLSGANVLNLSPAVAEDLGTEAGTGGVVIGDVQPDSPAQRVGFRKGDIVVAVNGAQLETTKALETATRDRKRLWEITISRDGQVVTTTFGG